MPLRSSDEENKREQHNALERGRRGEIKWSFASFAEELPAFKQKKCRATRINILKEGAKFIKKAVHANHHMGRRIKVLKNQNNTMERKIQLLEEYVKAGDFRKANTVIKDLEHKMNQMELTSKHDDKDSNKCEEPFCDLEGSSEVESEGSEKDVSFTEHSGKEKKSQKQVLKTVFKRESMDLDIENMPSHYNEVLFNDQLFN